MRIKEFGLQRVHYMPKEIGSGVLYVSEEYGAVAHLCACGCGSKVSTPLGPTEWTFEEQEGRPTLRPSIGNWQLPCQSHYWITSGKVTWAPKWTLEQILVGRRAEEEYRRAYFDALDQKRRGLLQRLWRWIQSIFYP